MSHKGKFYPSSTCCKDCEKRHPLCHADCPDKAKTDAARQEMKKHMAKENPCMEYQIAKKEKTQKKVRHHKRK